LTVKEASSPRRQIREKLAYGELIGGKKFNLALNRDAKRKPASE